MVDCIRESYDERITPVLPNETSKWYPSVNLHLIIDLDHDLDEQMAYAPLVTLMNMIILSCFEVNFWWGISF